MQIELIQQHDDGSPVYPGDPGLSDGFHYLCYWAHSLADDGTLCATGSGGAYLAEFGPLNFGYFDTRATIGCFMEVLERQPETQKLFASVAEATMNWDGRRDPSYRLINLGLVDRR